MPVEASPLHIERREFKYLIDEALAARIRDAIRPFCTLDEHAVRRPGGRYLIDSLYYDSPAFGCLRATEDEHRDRFKVRVRTYPDAPGAPFFLEVKRRFHDIIVKDRARVGPDWPALLDGDVDARPEVAEPRARAGIARFVSLVRTHHMAPALVVRYAREPWVSAVDHYGRVTFDRAITSQRAQGTSFDLDPSRWRPADVPLGAMSTRSPTILELKFTTAVPRWMVGIVQRFDLLRQAFSKYGYGLRSHLGEGMDRLPRVPGWRA